MTRKVSHIVDAQAPLRTCCASESPELSPPVCPARGGSTRLKHSRQEAPQGHAAPRDLPGCGPSPLLLRNEHPVTTPTSVLLPIIGLLEAVTRFQSPPGALRTFTVQWLFSTSAVPRLVGGLSSPGCSIIAGTVCPRWHSENPTWAMKVTALLVAVEKLSKLLLGQVPAFGPSAHGAPLSTDEVGIVTIPTRR